MGWREARRRLKNKGEEKGGEERGMGGEEEKYREKRKRVRSPPRRAHDTKARREFANSSVFEGSCSHSLGYTIVGEFAHDLLVVR